MKKLIIKTIFMILLVAFTIAFGKAIFDSKSTDIYRQRVFIILVIVGLGNYGLNLKDNE